MTESPAPHRGPLNSSLFLLVTEKLPDEHGDPLKLIVARRDPEQADGPMAYSRIAHELSNLTGVYVSHEAVRRWHRAHLEANGQDPAIAETD